MYTRPKAVRETFEQIPVGGEVIKNVHKAPLECRSFEETRNSIEAITW
jgi:hypothetical protein